MLSCLHAADAKQSKDRTISPLHGFVELLQDHAGSKVAGSGRSHLSLAFAQLLCRHGKGVGILRLLW